MNATSINVNNLVDLGKGHISRDLFASQDLYAQEQNKIFAHAWLYIGHESQIPQPGNFILSRMGEESVILTRDKGGQIRVLLNSCRHRGMRVCRYDEGKTSRFYCPYHAWIYGLDGSLVHAQSEKKAYGTSFRKEDWGLKQVAQVQSFHGLIFATWDPNAPSFDDYLGDAKMMLDLAFRGWDGEGEIEVMGTVQKWVIPSNWKFVAENFFDGLHGDPTHQSVETVAINPNGAASGRRDDIGTPIKCHYGNGHGGTYFDYGDGNREEYLLHKITAEYFRKTYEKRRRVLGERGSLISAVGTIFPNMSFHGQQPWTVLVAHPSGVNRTEMWRTYFVDKDAPSEVKDYLRHYFMRYCGPGGMVETDDMENWGSATLASKGEISRQFPYNYMADMQSHPNPRVPGAYHVSPESEQTAVNFYSAWSRMLGYTEMFNANAGAAE